MNIYICSQGCNKDLIQELGSDAQEFDLSGSGESLSPQESFILSDRNLPNSIWAQDILYDIDEIEFDSISEAAQKLKSIHSHWVGKSVASHRRARLIQEKLNYYKLPKLKFLSPLPQQKFGLWIMVDKNKILASHKTRSPLPFGEIFFQEDKETSPSRAYLKLWELFTIYRICPKKGERVLDMGSCPGGWSWVLSELGCHVLSVDKAPLDPKISKIKNIQFLKKDAFKLDPREIDPVDWFFSDIICEPQKLYDLVLKWMEIGVKNFVCTIKFKGKTDWESIEKFKKISGSKLFHLYNNKHEITWILRDSH